MELKCRLLSNLQGAHLAKTQPVTISSPNLEIGTVEMDDIFTELFADPLTGIIPPETDDALTEDRPSCLCCGCRSALDQDGCGICDECLSAEMVRVFRCSEASPFCSCPGQECGATGQGDAPTARVSPLGNLERIDVIGNGDLPEENLADKMRRLDMVSIDRSLSGAAGR